MFDTGSVTAGLGAGLLEAGRLAFHSTCTCYTCTGL